MLLMEITRKTNLEMSRCAGLVWLSIQNNFCIKPLWFLLSNCTKSLKVSSFLSSWLMFVYLFIFGFVFGLIYNTHSFSKILVSSWRQSILPLLNRVFCLQHIASQNRYWVISSCKQRNAWLIILEQENPT